MYKYKLTADRLPLTIGIALLILMGSGLNGDAYAAHSMYAQSATATLSGTVVDENDALISGVNITVIDVDTSLHRRAVTNANGYFSVTLLPPGRYTMLAQRQGFATAEAKDLKLNVGDQLVIKIQLKIGNISESFTVSGALIIQTESAAIGTVVDRQLVENLPLNGRSFHALIELTPGVVLTQAHAGEAGQFSVNGQRSNANYFMIDGVGANIGISGSLFLGQGAGGTVPAFSELGTTNNLASVDAVQEMRIETSTYAAEFGRTPGAQVSLITRSGTNRFHAALFDYFRNDALDATDWFANNQGLAKPPFRQNDFGGVFGGPIFKNQTFFFFSYEGLRLRVPRVAITHVPSLAVRQGALPQMQPFLNAFPIPNGKDFEDGLSEFSASFSDPINLDATSIRVDHTFSPRLTLFGRYNHAPSKTIARGPGLSLNNLATSSSKTETLTLGLIQSYTPSISNDLRFNYSRSGAGGHFLLDEFGGASPLPDSVLFPSFTRTGDALFTLNFANSSYIVGKNADNVQRQINVVDGLSVLAGAHRLKMGFDYRRLSPISDLPSYSMTAVFFDISQAQTAIASFVDIGATLSRVFPIFNNFSVYAQDTWKATPRLTFVYGLRWEFNPPPKEKNGNDPFTVVGLDNPATMTLGPKGTPLWETSYKNFAPRFGVAYQLSQAKGLETVLRGGAGIFYDLGTGPAGRAMSAGGFPYSSEKWLFDVPFPLSPGEAAPAAFSISPPYPTFFVNDPDLKMPRTYQWNVSIEQSLGINQAISVSYVGAAGRDLLRREVLTDVNLPNPNFPRVLVARNAATSDYHALQLNFQSRLSHRMQALASYSWSHSIDGASEETASNVPAAIINPNLNRGPSNFDVRHSLSGALTYDIPSVDLRRPIDALLSGWSVDAMFRARSATPVDVVFRRPLFGIPQVNRLNLVPGVPLYVDDPAVAGGRRINRDAFIPPPPGQQGNLGRNSLRGFSASQLDLALRRKFQLTEWGNLQLRADFFNIFNHPNFANPFRLWDDPNLFGQSIQTLGQSLSDGGGGLNPLYQIGGPRSIQIALRLQF